MIKENILTKVKNKKYIEDLNTKEGKIVMGTIALIILGIALPRVFHLLAGSSAGAIFLPMHIAVLIAALTFGGLSASCVAGTSIICSYLLTGMPSIVRLPYMLIELLIYAILLSVLNKKFNSYISLVATIVLGRVLYAGILAFSINILGLPTYGLSVIDSIIAGLPGIAIQLLFVPVIAYSIKKGIKLDD